MSLLVILLPPRPRADTAPAAPADYAFALSADGRSLARQGRAPAAQLPRTEHCCAVLADADLGWQRIDLPKAPAARLRDALGAVLEEQLLDEPEQLHLALEPGATGGQPAWVAVTHKAWLSLLLADLEAAGLSVQRVLPPAWPDAEARVHALPAAREEDAPVLVISHAGGVARTSAGGSWARQALARLGGGTPPCSAHPAVVGAVERWLGAPATVLGDAERALQAAQGPWNLRQFDLAARHRGLRALRELLRGIALPEWRPVRVALVALLLLNLVGLNAWAWRQDRLLRERQQAMTQLLQDTHPQVRTVLDAPLQMQQETDRLRSNAGRPGPAELEPMLAAAAAAWPEGMAPPQALRFEPGRLTLATPGWAEGQRAAFVDRARAAGYRAESQGQDMVLSRTDRS